LKTRVLELERLERLQNLENLERLEQLKNQQRQIQFFKGDYRQVQIPEGAVIYCDPPYAGTSEYKEGAFNHLEFWDWVRDKSKTHKVYVSEYKAPVDFKAILKFDQASTLSATSNTTASVECMFTIRTNQHK
jgi:DNA adenine methylase